VIGIVCREVRIDFPAVETPRRLSM